MGQGEPGRAREGAAAFRAALATLDLPADARAKVEALVDAQRALFVGKLPRPVPAEARARLRAGTGPLRAQMATFPPRRGIVTAAIDRLLPQVDQLHVVLNGYDAVPEALASSPKITAVIPDRDLRDAGKFWPVCTPEDTVLLVDDDLAYPPDYVARLTAEAARIGWEGNAFTVLGLNARAPAPNRSAWQVFKIQRHLKETVGVEVPGTGTALARGDLIAPLAAIEPLHGAADLAWALWLRQRGARLWAIAREADWLVGALPEALQASSLFETATRHPTPAMIRATQALRSSCADNRGLPWHRFAAGERAAPAPTPPRPPLRAVS